MLMSSEHRLVVSPTGQEEKLCLEGLLNDVPNCHKCRADAVKRVRQGSYWVAWESR